MGHRTIQLRAGARLRSYLLVEPDPGSTPRGLIVQLHGRGIDPVAFDRWTGLGERGPSEGLTVAMPAAVDETWNDGRQSGTRRGQIDDLEFLRLVIDDVRRRQPLSTDRVFLVGMSNGATMAGRAACEMADRITGIAQVAGTAGLEVAGGCRASRPVAILSIHGTADRFSPYDGGTARGLLARLLVRGRVGGRVGPSIGVDDCARQWVEIDGAAATPTTDRVAPDTVRRAWGTDVVFYRVEGGGHTWPGAGTWIPPIFGRTSRAFSATDAILRFIAEH